MPKKPRLKGDRLYHHIYAWGNDRHPIFLGESHYEKYLAYLELFSLRYDIAAIAYALMEWHIHLFIYDKYGKLSEFMNNLHGEYARFFNKDTKRIGHVFGERFNNRIVQANNYGLWLTRYIHRQAVEAGLVANPRDYPWTSYRAYIGLAPAGFLRPELIWEQFGSGQKIFRYYESFVLGIEDGPVNWAKSQSGEVVGNRAFIKRFEHTHKKEVVEAEDLKNKDFADLIKKISKRLGIDERIVLDPVGRVEKYARHQVFHILVNDYGLSYRRVARIFRISPMTVINALRSQQEVMKKIEK